MQNLERKTSICLQTPRKRESECSQICAFLPHNWVGKAPGGLEVKSKDIQLPWKELKPHLTVTLCSQIAIQDIWEETQWASTFLQDNHYLCVVVERKPASGMHNAGGGWWTLAAGRRRSDETSNDLFRGGSIMQAQSSNLLPCRVLQLEVSEKIESLPSQGSRSHSPDSCPQTHLNHSNSSRRTASSPASPLLVGCWESLQI